VAVRETATADLGQTRTISETNSDEVRPAPRRSHRLWKLRWESDVRRDWSGLPDSLLSSLCGDKCGGTYYLRVL